MNESIRYTFRSHTGKTVTIRTRLGEDEARSFAMATLWGPPEGWCGNAGLGLSLIEQTETQHDQA